MSDRGGGLGWFWVPGGVYAPARVEWLTYRDYVGWCPPRSYDYIDGRGRRRRFRRDRRFDGTDFLRP